MESLELPLQALASAYIPVREAAACALYDRREIKDMLGRTCACLVNPVRSGHPAAGAEMCAAAASAKPPCSAFTDASAQLGLAALGGGQRSGGVRPLVRPLPPRDCCSFSELIGGWASRHPGRAPSELVQTG